MMYSKLSPYSTMSSVFPDHKQRSSPNVLDIYLKITWDKCTRKHCKTHILQCLQLTPGSSLTLTCKQQPNLQCSAVLIMQNFGSKPMSAFPVLAPNELPLQHPPLRELADDLEVHGEGHIRQSEPKLISNLQHWRLLCRILGCLQGQ